MNGEKLLEIVPQDVLDDLTNVERFEIKCEFFGARGRCWCRRILVDEIACANIRAGRVAWRFGRRVHLGRRRDRKCLRGRTRIYAC